MKNQSIFYFTVFMLIIRPRYAKFCGFPVIMDIVSLVLSGHRALVGPKFFLVGISWIQNIFSWVFLRFNFFFLWLFRGSKYFTHGYFVDLSFLLVGIPWIQFFFSWIFWGSKFLKLSVNFSDKQNEAYGWVILI